MVVATAAIRTARNRDALIAAIDRAGGLASSVLSGDEEARLSFVGATRTFLSRRPAPSPWSTSAAARQRSPSERHPSRMLWCESLAIGSGLLADSCTCGRTRPGPTRWERCAAR